MNIFSGSPITFGRFRMTQPEAGFIVAEGKDWEQNPSIELQRRGANIKKQNNSSRLGMLFFIH